MTTFTPGALTRRAKLLLPVFVGVLVGLAVHRMGVLLAAPALVELGGPTMGTTWSVKLGVELPSGDARRRIEEAIAAELAEVNGLMSTWDADSELSRFNRHASREPFRVSPPTLEIFGVARQVSERSGGAFDVTVGPLVDAWGFGATDHAPEPPNESRVAALRDRVGYRLVGIDAASQALVKRNPAAVCDLSAIAKGWAVDRVAAALRELGHRDFLVEIGGELRGAGERPDGRPWRVAIEVPDPDARRIHRALELRDAALATSGDYRNFYEEDGVWISHLIDPRSGRPIAHDLASVSVVHAEAAWADAWATALIVLGPEEGWEVARREKLAAYFILRRGEAYSVRSTPAFDARVAEGRTP